MSNIRFNYLASDVGRTTVYVNHRLFSIYCSMFDKSHDSAVFDLCDFLNLSFDVIHHGSRSEFCNDFLADRIKEKAALLSKESFFLSGVVSKCDHCAGFDPA